MQPLQLESEARESAESRGLRVKLQAQHDTNLEVRSRLRGQKESIRRQRLDLWTIRQTLSGKTREA